MYVLYGSRGIWLALGPLMVLHVEPSAFLPSVRKEKGKKKGNKERKKSMLLFGVECFLFFGKHGWGFGFFNHGMICFPGERGFGVKKEKPR